MWRGYLREDSKLRVNQSRGFRDSPAQLADSILSNPRGLSAWCMVLFLKMWVSSCWVRVRVRVTLT